MQYLITLCTSPEPFRRPGSSRCEPCEDLCSLKLEGHSRSATNISSRPPTSVRGGLYALRFIYLFLSSSLNLRSECILLRSWMGKLWQEEGFLAMTIGLLLRQDQVIDRYSVASPNIRDLSVKL